MIYRNRTLCTPLRHNLGSQCCCIRVQAFIDDAFLRVSDEKQGYGR